MIDFKITGLCSSCSHILFFGLLRASHSRNLLITHTNLFLFSLRIVPCFALSQSVKLNSHITKLSLCFYAHWSTQKQLSHFFIFYFFGLLRASHSRNPFPIIRISWSFRFTFMLIMGACRKVLNPHLCKHMWIKTFLH